VSEATVASALAATGIGAERVGSLRASRLAPGERAVYSAILRSFVDGTVPDRATIASESTRHGLAVDDIVATLAREDLVHLDPSGQVEVAYPFSGRPTRHRVRFNGHEVFAMCAIDALGIAPMLDAPIEVSSRDPLDGHAITVSLAPDGTASWEPEQAVVVTGCTRESAAFSSCCQVLNFFASPANAERYLLQHTDVRGFAISIPQAVELGRLTFGDVMMDA